MQSLSVKIFAWNRLSELCYPFIRRNLRYTALKFQILPGMSSMSVKMAEEAAAQVPADDFQALEQKVYRTIELYKIAQEARATAERDVKRLREQLEEREEELETLHREMVQLRREREDVRGRVEKMLRQVETLTQEQAAS
jgi:predicted  nucleic acid-binding Zn-ribbon protein